jgi:hypothetical protein
MGWVTELPSIQSGPFKKKNQSNLDLSVNSAPKDLKDQMQLSALDLA